MTDYGAQGRRRHCTREQHNAIDLGTNGGVEEISQVLEVLRKRKKRGEAYQSYLEATNNGGSVGCACRMIDEMTDAGEPQ